jgi:RNA polymerase sigma-70 factor (ECF subfamily)
MASDETLVQQIRDGDLDAFDALYRRYSRRLFSYILRLVRDDALAEDLLQEVLLTVLRDRSFDLSSGRFGGWLFTVARNRCTSELRKHPHRDAALDDLAPAEDSAPSPEQQAARRQQVARLHRMLQGLPEGQRDALLLKQVGELSYAEIARVQRVPEGTVKSRTHLAIRALQRLLLEGQS